MGSTRTEEWGRWTGSVGDLADLATLALRLVHERLPTDADAESAASFDVEVQLPGLDSEYGSPEALRTELRDGDLPRLERVRMTVGSIASDSAVAVNITFNRSRGATLVVQGADRATVEGVATVLSERLAEGGVRRHIDPFTYAMSAAGLVALALFAVAAASEDAPESEQETTLADLAVILALFGGVGLVVVLVYMFMAWAKPQLEVVPLGEKTRWRRVRARVFAVTAAVVAAAFGLFLERLV